MDSQLRDIKRRRKTYDDTITNDCNNPGRLKYSIETRQWSKCRVLVKSHDAIRWITPRNVLLNEGALHWACRYRAPVDVVRSICDVVAKNAHHHSDTTTTTTTTTITTTPSSCSSLFFNNVLHTACSTATEKVLALLLARAPPGEITMVTPNMRDSPLHYAVHYNRSPSVLRRLLVAHPGAVRRVNLLGVTPLADFLQRWGTELERFYPHEPERLPRPLCFLVNSGDSRDDVDDDGLTSVTESLILLITAHVYGSVVVPPRKQQRIPILHEALKLRLNGSGSSSSSSSSKGKDTVVDAIPPNFLLVLLHYHCRSPVTHRKLECAVHQDEAGNFLLHLMCNYMCRI